MEYMMVTSCVTGSCCRLTCTNSTTPVRKLERNETKTTEVIYYVDDMGAAPLE